MLKPLTSPLSEATHPILRLVMSLEYELMIMLIRYEAHANPPYLSPPGMCVSDVV